MRRVATPSVSRTDDSNKHLQRITGISLKGNPTSQAGDRPKQWMVTQLSSVAPLELLHELDERIDAGFREGVVERSPHPADRPVALEPVEAGRRGFLDEPVLDVFGREPERDVHQRSAVLVCRSAIETAAVDLGV